MPGGVESNVRYYAPYPLFVKRARGGYFWDVDGHRYLDLMLGMGALLLGHRHSEVLRAVRAQLGADVHHGYARELSLRYIRMVQRALPSMERMRFANSGSEATMYAIRVARAYTGKERIAKAEGAYHGGHDAVLQSLEAGPQARGPAESPHAVPYGRGVPRGSTEATVVFPFNDLEHTEAILRRHAEELAAVIVEPVQAGGGCFLPKDHYLEGLRKITTELGLLLIFDEVLTGFRLAFGGAQEYFGVRPDLTAIAKVAGGGFQLAAFGGRAELMDVLAPKPEAWREGTYHGGTYNAHPISVAAGLRTLEILGRGKPYQRLNRLGEQFFQGLRDEAEDADVPVQVNAVGSLGQVYFADHPIDRYRESLDADFARWDRWFLACLVRGVFFGVPHGDDHFFTALVHTREDLERATEVAGEAFRAVKA